MRILGSAVQQDGPSASLTAPNGSSQRRLLETVRRVVGGEEGVPVLEAHGTGTALGDPIEVQSAAFGLEGGASVSRETRDEPTGGRRGPGFVARARRRPGRESSSGATAADHKGAMRVAQVERGPPGGGGGGRGPLVAHHRTCARRACRRQRAAARVRGSGTRLLLPADLDCLRRLNAHLSSVASSRTSSFEMPVEPAARARADSLAYPRGRLSSFGFSGTIAHGAFLAQGSPPRDDGTSHVAASCYRS